MATPLENFELQQPNEALNDNGDPPVLSTTETVPTASESTPNEPVINSTVGSADASNADGVIEKREEAWQVSTMPEEKRFFSLDANLLDAAVSAVTARLEEKDSNIRGTWLLTEIDHWDLEKEKVILLSDSNIISVKYNFILAQIEELKFIPIPYISELLFGDFKYPSSYVYSRNTKGLKVTWGKKDTPIPFKDRWNPFSMRLPHTTFASHLLVRRKKLVDPRLTIDSAVPEFEKAIVDFWKQNGQIQETSEGGTQRAGEDFRVTEGEIIVNHLAGLTALIHNQSAMGFNKRRGALNW